MLMTLNVLWKSTVGSKAIEKHNKKRPDTINIIAEAGDEKAAEHKDWLNVLIDGHPSELLDAPNLKHVIVPYVGVRESLRQAILERPHLSLYNSHYNDAFVAQHAVALLLAVSNKLIQHDHSMRQGIWKPNYVSGIPSLFLEAKTCLLLGYGAIAKEIQPRVEAFGMNIETYKRNPDPSSKITTYSPDQLYAALSNADVIMISLPSTPETQNLLDKKAFEHIKEGSIIVNVGRGDIIDQHALYKSLKNNHLLGAGIDVWWNYPKTETDKQNTYPADAPLHELPNIIMSPHRASNTQNWQETSYKDVIKTLEAIQKGETRNLVDLEKGY